MKATAVFDGRGIRITAESTCCGSAFTIRMKRAAISEYFAAASGDDDSEVVRVCVGTSHRRFRNVMSRTGRVLAEKT